MKSDILAIIMCWQTKYQYAGKGSSFYIVEEPKYYSCGYYFDTLEQLVEKYNIIGECDVDVANVEKLLCLI